MNLGVFVAVVAICMLLLASSAEAVTLPAGFRAVPVFEGLQQPAAVRFSGGLNDPVFVAGGQTVGQLRYLQQSLLGLMDDEMGSTLLL